MVQPLIPVEDLSALVNKLAAKHLGSEAVTVADDLSNLADFGKAYEQLDSGTKDIVTSGMITLVTEQLFLVKEYKGNGVDIIRSRSEYDASDGLVQKNRPALPTAVSDIDTYDPEPGSSSDPFENYPINFETEYFSKPFSFRYQWSKPDRWMTGMFLSRTGLINAVAAIDQSVRNALALNIEGITMSTLRASMALNLSGVSDLTGAGNARAINLLSGYNKAYGQKLTAEKALQTPDFLRYSTVRIFQTLDYMRSYTRLFNEKSFPNFSSSPNFVMLSSFKRGMDAYMLSDVFNKEYLALPNADSVSAWKGFLLSANAEPSFEAASTINDKIEVSWETKPVSVNTSGVVAHVYDSERVGVYNLATLNTSVRDDMNLKTNYFTHVFGRTIVDPYENGVTFYVKDPAPAA